MSPQRQREQRFWDQRVPDIDRCRREVELGPDPNTARALDLLSPLQGRTVLDIGCGAGVLAAWLAARGARIVGIDISPDQIARAKELHADLGFESRFIAAPVSGRALDALEFDRLAGRYVLHHLELPVIVPELAALLKPGGTAAFVETAGLNPILRFARTHLAGRWGIPRYGSDDERPLSRGDLADLKGAFGELRLEVAELHFFTILDRQVFRFRSPFASAVLRLLDGGLLRLGFDQLGYHQVVFMRKRG